jgi:hypothetical protein
MGANIMNLYPKKYIDVDMDFPDAFGFCDRTGFPTNRADLVKQYQYSGNQLIWTGLYVNEKFMDEPNTALQIYLNLSDPTPVLDARPPLGQILSANSNSLPFTNQIVYNPNQLSSEYNGVTAAPSNVLAKDSSEYNWFQQ